MSAMFESEIYFSKYNELFEAGLHEDAKKYVIGSLSVDPTNIPLYCLASNISLLEQSPKDVDNYLNKAISLLRTMKYRNDLKIHAAVLDYVIINFANDTLMSDYVEILNTNMDNLSFGNKTNQIDIDNIFKYAPVFCGLLGAANKYDQSSRLAEIVIERIKKCTSCIWEGKEGQREGKIDEIMHLKGDDIKKLKKEERELYYGNWITYYTGISRALDYCTTLNAIDDFEISGNEEKVEIIYSSWEKNKLSKVILEISTYIIDSGKENWETASQLTIIKTVGTYLEWIKERGGNLSESYKLKGDELLSNGMKILEYKSFEEREFIFKSFDNVSRNFIKDKNVIKKMRDKLLEQYEVWKPEIQLFHKNEARKTAEMQFRMGISEKIADTGEVEKDFIFKSAPGSSNPKKYGWISGIISLVIFGKIFMKLSGAKGAFIAIIISIAIGYFVSKLTKEKVISNLADVQYNYWMSKEDELLKEII